MIQLDRLTVTLAASDWQIVLCGLAELPYRVSAATIGRIESQLREEPDAATPTLANGAIHVSD